MWKLCIVDNNKKTESLNFVFSKLSDSVSGFGGTIEICSALNTVFVRINEAYVPFVKAVIKNTIAEAIVELYKPIYFESRLNISKKFGLSGVALLKTICTLDKNEDIIEIKRKLDICEGEFHLDSFFEFSLSDLKIRWQELQNVVLSNLTDIVLTDSFLDIVRYLLKLMDKNFDTIKVVEKNNKVLLLDKNYRQIVTQTFEIEDEFKDEKILQKLIELQPLNVECEGVHCKELKNLTQSIFN